MHAWLGLPTVSEHHPKGRPPVCDMMEDQAMSQASHPYEAGLDKNAANFVPLTPLGFLVRTAAVYPDRTAVIHGERRYTWRRALRALPPPRRGAAARGIGRGDTVAVMAPNMPEAFEAHFGVPMAGAVLNALNIRLDAETIAFILEHGEAKVLITDREFAPVIGRALALLDKKPLVIDIDDPLGPAAPAAANASATANTRRSSPPATRTSPG